MLLENYDAHVQQMIAAGWISAGDLDGDYQRAKKVGNFDGEMTYLDYLSLIESQNMIQAEISAMDNQYKQGELSEHSWLEWLNRALDRASHIEWQLGL